MIEPARLAIVGFGLIGRRHADAISDIPGIKLAAVVEPNQAVQSDVENIGADLFDSLEDLFASKEIDGVILSTPTPLHAEQAMTCIENRCAILVEKPLAVTSHEARKVVESALRTDVPILVGHHRRYNGIVRAAKSAIENGDIGDIRAVSANCWFYKPDDYFDGAPWRKQLGAGPISVNLTHDVDLLRYFCGDVKSVQAHSRPSVRGYDNEDVAAAILEFGSGAIATITVSDSIVSPWSWEMTSGENPAYPHTDESCYLIGGSDGAISIPDLRVWKHGAKPDWWSPIFANTLISSPKDPLKTQIEHFLNVIQGTELPVVSGLEGLKTLQVIEAIQNAAIDKTTIEITGYEDVLGGVA